MPNNIKLTMLVLGHVASHAPSVHKLVHVKGQSVEARHMPQVVRPNIISIQRSSVTNDMQVEII